MYAKFYSRSHFSTPPPQTIHSTPQSNFNYQQSNFLQAAAKPGIGEKTGIGANFTPSSAIYGEGGYRQIIWRSFLLVGEFLSLVDLAFYPWFERFAVLEHYRGFALPSECVRLQQWWEAMGNCPSVRAIANQSKFYIEQYLQYASNTATGITAR